MRTSRRPISTCTGSSSSISAGVPPRAEASISIRSRLPLKGWTDSPARASRPRSSSKRGNSHTA